MRGILIILLACLLGAALPAAAQKVGEPLEPVAGLYLEAAPGLMVNVRIVDRQLRLYTTDSAGVLLNPPFEKAIVILEERVGDQDEHRLVLRRDADPWLTHVRKVYPPYKYRVKVILYPSAESDEGKLVLPERSLEQ